MHSFINKKDPLCCLPHCFFPFSLGFLHIWNLFHEVFYFILLCFKYYNAHILHFKLDINALNVDCIFFCYVKPRQHQLAREEALFKWNYCYEYFCHHDKLLHGQNYSTRKWNWSTFTISLQTLGILWSKRKREGKSTTNKKNELSEKMAKLESDCLEFYQKLRGFSGCPCIYHGPMPIHYHQGEKGNKDLLGCSHWMRGDGMMRLVPPSGPIDRHGSPTNDIRPRDFEGHQGQPYLFI